MIFRSPWDAFPDIAVQTTVAKLKSHPDYHAAKHGDQDGALRVIDQLFKPGKLTDPCDLIVPVLQLDAEIGHARKRIAKHYSPERESLARVLWKQGHLKSICEEDGKIRFHFRAATDHSSTLRALPGLSTGD